MKSAPKMGLIMTIKSIEFFDSNGKTITNNNNNKNKAIIKKPHQNDEFAIQINKNTIFNGTSTPTTKSFMTESPDDIITLTMMTVKESTKIKNILIYFTSFIWTVNKTCPSANGYGVEWFKCDLKYCIYHNFQCDSIANCINESDESDRSCGQWYFKHRSLFWSLFILGWAIALFFLILSLIFLIFCKNKLSLFCC